MHVSADITSHAVAQEHARAGMVVVDVGGKNVNGSMRPHFENQGVTYVSVDMEAHPSVDIVTLPNQPLPFEDASVDIVLSSSCFEHDPVFWVTFKELCRIVKPNGIIYISAPSNGQYHRFPGDNWRFYMDAAQSLAAWSCTPSYTKHDISKAFSSATTLDACRHALETGGNVYPVVVVEQFFGGPYQDTWIDCNMIFKRVADAPVDPPILLNRDAAFNGPVCRRVRDAGVPVNTQ